MSYILIDLPKFDSQSILPEFKRLVLNKALLETPLSDKEKELYTLYAIVDGARNQEVDQYLDIYQPEYRTFYPEDYRKGAGYAQPFLVEMKTTQEFTTWFIENVYGNSGTLYLFSKLDIDTLQENINIFSIGEMEADNKETFFRFYDPRIFPDFLRILSANQLEALFATQSYLLCENYMNPEELDFYSYDPQTQVLHKATHDLTTTSTPLLHLIAQNHVSKKDKVFFQSRQESLYFSGQDIVILSQNKLHLHAKKVTYSLIQQYTPYKKKSIQSLYKEVLDLTYRGYALGLHEPDANYLWVVANTWHSDIEDLNGHERYGKIFEINGEVTQGQKKVLLRKLIDELKEKLKGKEK